MPKKGKKGAEQRTKGNVKVCIQYNDTAAQWCCNKHTSQAASSGRMAELMGGDQGFIGFDVVSSDTNGTL